MRWIHRHFRALWEPFIQSLCKRIHKSKFSEQLNGWFCTNWYQIAPIKSNWIKIKTCELLCNGCPQLDDVLFTSRCQHIVAGVESDGEDWLCVSTQDKKRLVDRNFVALMTLWQSPDVEIVVSRCRDDQIVISTSETEFVSAESRQGISIRQKTNLSGISWSSTG